jgi:hypothetical protein
MVFILEEGGFLGSVVLLLAFILTYYLYPKIKDGTLKATFRTIPTLEAIDEMVSRALEMGKAIHAYVGYDNLESIEGALTLAGIQITAHAIDKAAELGVTPIVTVRNPQHLHIFYDIFKEAYLLAGRSEEYDNALSNITYFAGRSADAHIIGIFERERPAVQFMFGSYHYETLLIANAATRTGAINLAGTSRQAQLPYLAAVSDYLLIGDEIFAAQAYLTREPLQLATIMASDIIKLFILAILLTGIIATTFGSDLIFRLIKI